MMDRRQFLIGLFGTAAVVAAGPIPKIIEELPEKIFEDYAKALPPMNEIYCNGKDYAFATIQYLNEPPYFKVSVLEGFRPMREESDRLTTRIIAELREHKW